MKIALASDHAGFKLKEELIRNSPDIDFDDLGTFNDSSVDYPDYADKVVEQIVNGKAIFGILICGTGIGMSIKANRNPKIRAALCHNNDYAKLAREHNNANVLVLGSRFINTKQAIEMVKIFLTTDFIGGRHKDRVNKL